MTLEEFGKQAEKERPMKTQSQTTNNLLGILIILTAAALCLGIGFVVGALAAWIW